MRWVSRFLVSSVLLWVAVAERAPATSGGPYAIASSVIAGGGATVSTGASNAIGGTVGQDDTGPSAGGTFVVNGGFWKSLLQTGPIPTATPIATASRTLTPSPTATVPTATRTTTAATIPTPSRTPTSTRTATVMPTWTRTAGATPTASATVGPDRGDANCDGRLSAPDLVALTRSILSGERAACGLDDVNGDGRVDGRDIPPLIEVLFGEP